MKNIGFGVLVFAVLALLVGGCTTGCSLTRIPAGHVGVITTFGAVHHDQLSEGLNLTAPWNSVYKVSLQTKEAREPADVPTKEGLTVHVECSIIFNLKKESAADIFQTIGDKYEDVIITPLFRSALRDVTSRFEAKDFYTANRSQVETALLKELSESLGPKGITVQADLLRDVTLPKSLKERIEAKLAADQDAQRMQFVLLKEKQEAERKAVEAKGIADAQKIIKADLSHEYLIYLWIEALKEGAKHNNAVIYVPTGGDGMPLFKGLPDFKKEIPRGEK